MEKKYLDYEGLVQVFNIVKQRNNQLESDVTSILNGMFQKISDLEDLIYTFHPKPVIQIPTITVEGANFDEENENVTELVFNIDSEVDITTLELNWSGVDWSKEGNLTNSWDIINPQDNEGKLREFGIDNLGVSTNSYTLNFTSLLDTLPKIVDDEENVGISIIATNEAGTESKTVNIKVEKQEEPPVEETAPVTIRINGESTNFKEIFDTAEEINFNISSSKNLSSLILEITSRNNGIDLSEYGFVSNKIDLINLGDNTKAFIEHLNGLNIGTISNEYVLTLPFDFIYILISEGRKQNSGTISIAVIPNNNYEEAANILINYTQLKDTNKLEIVGSGSVTVKIPDPQYEGTTMESFYSISNTYTQGTYVINKKILGLSASGEFEKLHLPDYSGTTLTEVTDVKELRIGGGNGSGTPITTDTTLFGYPSLEKLKLDGDYVYSLSSNNKTLKFFNSDLSDFSVGSIKFNGSGGSPLSKYKTYVDVSCLTMKSLMTLATFVENRGTIPTSNYTMYLKVNADVYDMAVEMNNEQENKWTIESI